MRYALVLVALLAAGCGSDSPVAPTIQPASIVQQGNLVVQTCSVISPSLFSCFSYSGTVKNVGTGCASGVRGVTKTFDATTRQQVGSSEWNYSSRVRANEEIGYVGFNLAVSAPLTGGWFYTTTASWDNVACQ